MGETFTYDNNEDIRQYVYEYDFDVKDFKDIFIYCEHYETRTSWGHRGGVRIPTQCSYVVKHKIRYLNRTWESYRYRKLLCDLLDDYATYLTGINYHKVLLLTTNELKDFKELKRSEFLKKYTWFNADNYRETKKHLIRIGEIEK